MKTKNIEKLQVGDIISSPKFENLLMCYDEYFNSVYDNNDLKKHKKIKNFLVVKEHEKDSKYFQKIDKNDKFVVMRISEEGGGCGMGAGDVYPDLWTVNAKRLKNNKFNSNEITIQFNEDIVENVNFHGKMKMIFI